MAHQSSLSHQQLAGGATGGEAAAQQAAPQQ
jgi:hypothetical protein